MSKNSIPNFTYVQMSLLLVFNALTELQYLSKARKKDEYEIVSGNPFHFYAVTLQYMFTMEYTKLLEPGHLKYPFRHFASLEKLSARVLESQGASFEKSHNSNIADLTTIRESNLFKMIRERRDQKYGHTDGNYSGDPMSINVLTDSELIQALNHLDVLKIINNRCTCPYDYEFAFQHADTHTENFIKFSAVFRKFYFDNYLEAQKRGYFLS